jgi:hypothetical protein
MVITGVADRATDRISHLVYLDAATPVNGAALTDISPAQMKAARAAGRVVDGVELVLWPGTEPIPHYGLTDPDDIAWTTPKLTPHPYRCFEQPLRLTNEAAVWDIPQTHIVCTNTLPHRDPEQLAKARAAGRLWDIDTGHDLMISESKAIANLLARVPSA